MFGKIFWFTCKVLFAVAAALFLVYYCNLDQRLLDGGYRLLCRLRGESAVSDT